MISVTPKPKAILFDWDNTLADTWPIIYRALTAAFEALGHTPWSFDDVKHGREGIHHSLRESFPRIFGDKWEEAKKIYFDTFLATHLQEIKKLPGVEEMLAHLVQEGIYLAVVSNKTGDYLRIEVAHLGWDRYFSRIIGATDAARDKPHADPIHMALEGSGIVAGPDVWFVGDSATDLEAALNAGCTPIYFGDKDFPKEHSYLQVHNDHTGNPVVHYKDHDELLTALKELM